MSDNEKEDSDKINEEDDDIALEKLKLMKKDNKKNVFKLDDSDISDHSDNEVIVIKEMKKANISNRSTLNTPWIEKYRPHLVEDLVLDQGTLNKVKKIIHDRDMPNLIITGVPGIGKTTTILCIAKNLLGKYFDQGVLELNASDERGVKTVQESIEYFCKKRLKFEDHDQYAHHKIVLLDEADNMTKKAQQSINNLMESYHETTRFAFTCNNSSDIIEAIQSRCIIFRYGRLSNQQITQRLKQICQIENVPHSDEGIDAIVVTAQGDLRQAINNLQLTYNGYLNIIPANVYKLCDRPHPLIIQNIFIACYEKDIRLALKYLNELREKGYSSSDISISMINTLKNAKLDKINEETKIKYMEEISKTCLIISKGINTPLQLSGTIAALCR
jgi:replication factor C subunit 2/4